MSVTNTELNLLDTDIEDTLRETLRAALGERCRAEHVAAVYDGDRSAADELWRLLCVEIGVAGLFVPEARGGAGGTLREAAVVAEELGRSVAPVPYLTHTMAVAAVQHGDADGLLEALAAGERIAALAVPLTTSTPTATASIQRDTAGRLTGSVTSVAGALEADVLVVPVATSEGTELRAVDRHDPEVDVAPVVSLDMTRQLADVTFTDASSRTTTATIAGRQAMGAAIEVGAVLLAAEQAGVAERCLTLAVDYVSERRQFGRVVGGFQAIKHRLADLWVRAESAQTAARYVRAAVAADDPDRSVAAALAQAYCSDAAVIAAEECIQLHGGIGMTWEHPGHLYLKRAKANQLALGTAHTHRQRLAELVDLPA